MNLYNEEHLEAQQESCNQVRENFTSSLSDDDKQKFKAVEEAVRTLEKAGIPFYLFPLLPADTLIGKVVWQWNSVHSCITKFDNAGKVTQESYTETELFHLLFFSGLFKQFTEAKKDLDFKEQWGHFAELVYRSLVIVAKLNSNDEEFDEIKKAWGVKCVKE